MLSQGPSFIGPAFWPAVKPRLLYTGSGFPAGGKGWGYYTGRLPSSAALPARRGAFAPLLAVVYSGSLFKDGSPGLLFYWLPAARASFPAAVASPAAGAGPSPQPKFLVSKARKTQNMFYL